jgi:hypothetical protein
MDILKMSKIEKSKILLKKAHFFRICHHNGLIYRKNTFQVVTIIFNIFFRKKVKNKI